MINATQVVSTTDPLEVMRYAAPDALLCSLLHRVVRVLHQQVSLVRSEVIGALILTYGAQLST